MTCVPQDELRRFRLQELLEDERKLVEEHLSECRSCRQRLVDDLRREEGSGPETVPDEILKRVRGLVDSQSNPRETQATRSTRPAQQRRPTRFPARTWLPLAAAIVAAVGVLWLVPKLGTESEPDSVLDSILHSDPHSVLRDAESVSGRLAPVEPAADVEIDVRINRQVRFRWTAVPEASLYRLVILGDDGGRILEHETVDAVVEIDVGAFAGSGGVDAYWLVEAQLPGGGRLHTDPRPIRLLFVSEPSP